MEVNLSYCICQVGLSGHSLRGIAYTRETETFTAETDLLGFLAQHASAHSQMITSLGHSIAAMLVGQDPPILPDATPTVEANFVNVATKLPALFPAVSLILSLPVFVLIPSMHNPVPNTIAAHFTAHLTHTPCHSSIKN